MSQSNEAKERILVIKLSALGDFIQALGPMKAIRDHHPEAHITLLTTKPYMALGKECGYFDAVWSDTRPKAWQVRRTLKLRQQLKSGNFDRVYDLQTSDRSSSYFKLMGAKVKWSGIARGCSHPHANIQRDFMHTIDRQAEQLEMAGIYETPMPDLSWAKGDLSRFDLDTHIALLVPGGAPHRPDKRWPAKKYAELAHALLERNIQPVMLGTAKEGDVLDEILDLCPDVIDLSSQTDFLELAALARYAYVAIGNDTGPMHLISLAGCKSIVLYSKASDPKLCGQRGPNVSILREDCLNDVTVQSVIEAVEA
ncbi:Glycosyl transferase, family 9 [Candidatus Terasakiella magnetica]|uniref:Glycosyl transferase, family 9 n=1 Tax=Candidatus Terasakiella magnetica TaxID=1867952 RepID=A0A1C3RLP2_9PROT|nr:glycosyltransferase family 9 protein [Candidatus Terasakiella magnetica]SCA58232.1 Glycosyl transferase, family 9 [Candidatus Terasakiella magnetica]